MLQKSKRSPTEFALPLKLSAHQNPYLPKLTIKTSNPPLPPGQKFKWLSPLSSNNQVYIGQSVPLWRNQKVRIALVWKCFVGGGGRYGRGNIGTSIQYKLYQKLRWKTTVLMGNPLSVHTSLHYPLKNHIQVAGQYSLVADPQIFHTFTFGLYRHNLNLEIARRIGLDTRVSLSDKRKFKGFDVEGKVSSDVTDLTGGQVQVGLSYLIEKVRAYAGVVATPKDRQLGFKFQFERPFQQIGKLGISTYTTDNTAAFYFSYKTPTLNLVFPFALMSAVIPTIIATAIFAIGYIWNRLKGKKEKNEQKQIQNNKSQEQRREQLKLIGDKANQIYEREKLANGLLIEEAYAGPRELLGAFITKPNKATLLLRSREYESIYDVTLSLRFYTLKSALRLPRGNKKNMLGFYCINEDDYFYIRYTLRGIQHQSMEKLQDSLAIY